MEVFARTGIAPPIPAIWMLWRGFRVKCALWLGAHDPVFVDAYARRR